MNTLKLLIKNNTMSSIDLAKLCIGEAPQAHGDFMRKALKVLGEKAVTTFSVTAFYDANGAKRERTILELPEREACLMAMSYSYELQAKVYDAWKSSTPVLSRVEIARENLRLIEREEELIAERDFALATKALIGNRREATAMNTASQATKKVNKLEIELDISKEYCTIKRMSALNHGTSYKWSRLKEASAILSKPPINVFDQNYGTVKGYHKSAWLEAYAIDLDELVENVDL
jgi:hypothetical protein